MLPDEQYRIQREVKQSKKIMRIEMKRAFGKALFLLPLKLQ